MQKPPRGGFCVCGAGRAAGAGRVALGRAGTGGSRSRRQASGRLNRETAALNSGRSPALPPPHAKTVR